MKNLIVILFLLPIVLLGQDINEVEQAFKDFQYEEVIMLSQNLHTNQQSIPEPDLIDLFRMKATSHYILGEIDSAAYCFSSILSIDVNYELDPVNNSPKIIALFNETKTHYLKNRAMQQIQTQPESPEQKMSIQTSTKQSFQGALLRSMVLPGWGHYNLEQKQKGLTLGIASIVALSSTIYFTYEANRLEQDYLNEVDVSKIDKRYADYNQAYKIRNISLSVYAALWLYAQIDISAQAFLEVKIDNNTKLHSYITPHGTYICSLTYKL
jgi:hypothetical protein